MTLLLSGASGVIGTNFLSILRDNGIDAVTIGRSTPPGQNSNRHINWDMNDSLPLNRLPRRITEIVHLAQSKHFKDFPAKSRDIFNTNLRSTFELLDFGSKNGVEKFVLASSGAVYRDSQSPFSESSPLRRPEDTDFYSSTKLSAENLLQCFQAELVPIALRFFFVYGPNQTSNMLIPRLISRVISEQPVLIRGKKNGDSLNPVSSFDAAKSVFLALGLKEPNTINIAGPETLSIRQIAESVAQITGKVPRFQHLEGQERNLVADITRMSTSLNAPTHRLQDYLSQLIRG